MLSRATAGGEGSLLCRSGWLPHEREKLRNQDLDPGRWRRTPACSDGTRGAGDAESEGSCPIDLSYEAREYHAWKRRDQVTPGRQVGTARYEYCGELGGMAKVARVPGFSPKVVIRVVDSRVNSRYVFISDDFLRKETDDELPPRIRKLLEGR